MQNWMEQAQQFQKTAGTNLPEGAATHYKQWADQQAGLYKNWTEAVEKMQSGFPTMQGFKMPGFTPEQASATFKEMVDAQTKYMSSFMQPQSWASGFNSLPGFNGAGFGGGFNPMTAMQQFTTQFNSTRGSALSQVFALYENWLSIYKSFAANASKGAVDFAAKLPEGITKDSLNQVLGSTESYMKVLEFWMPIYKSMQEKQVSFEDLQQFMHPARYKEVMDKVFEFGQPEMFGEFYANASRIMEAVSSNNQNSVKRYAELMQSNTKLVPELMTGDPQAALKIYENLYETYQRNFDPMVRAAINGRDGQALEILKELVKRFSGFSQKMNKVQYNTYVTGQKAMEAVVQKAVATFKDGGADAKSYNDFFKSWVEVNEKAFGELFKTEEFSKLQADLMNSSLEIRSEMQKLMEVFMADYPVVARSEMDELYKTIHELKTKVRSMEKDEKGVVTAEVAEDKSKKTPVGAKK